MEVVPETIKLFRRHTAALLAVAETILVPSVKCADEDDLGVMAVTFSAKQVEHLLSIHTLIDNQRYADATLVARVMLEGMAILVWAAKQPKSRPRDWRAYSLVFDLATLRSKQARGESVEPDLESEVLSRVAAEATRFLKPGSDATDVASYKGKWHLDDQGKALRIIDILKDFGDARFVDLYGDLSGWTHWNSKGIGSGLRKDGTVMHMSWNANYHAARALAGAFQSLHQTLSILDAHLSLGKAAALEGVAARYIAELKGGAT